MPKYISLSKGKQAIVDDGDYDAVSVHKWSITHNCNGYEYACRHDSRHGISTLHRFIMNPPKNSNVDHINGNGLDCRRSNMRIATHSQNSCNRKKRRDSKQPYRGISKHHGKWKAFIKVRGDYFYLGVYISPEQAARVYDEAARRLHGEFASLNFPDDE